MKHRCMCTFICFLSAALLLTGCAPKRKFYSDYIPDYEIIEDVILTTEFSEYSGDVEKIKVTVTNNSDRDIATDEQFYFQKKENGEWRGIYVTGNFTWLLLLFPSSTSVPFTATIKDHVLTPLPSGTYRIGLNFGNSHDGYKIAYTEEFTVK